MLAGTGEGNEEEPWLPRGVRGCGDAAADIPATVQMPSLSPAYPGEWMVPRHSG